MVYYLYCTNIPSLLLQEYLDLEPHKKASIAANNSPVYPSTELCMEPLFLIIISGLPHTFFLTSISSLPTQCLLFQTISQDCLFCTFTCV